MRLRHRKRHSRRIRQRGLESFRAEIAALGPFLRDRVGELQDWEQISLLTVAVDRLSRWSRPGLLCIGDAAHAMSPIGGVGINLAIQDAVATANILGPKLLQRTPSESELYAVQQRRNFPTRATQGLQIVIQKNVIRLVLGSAKPLTLPWPLKLLRRWPILRRIPARVIGVGFQRGINPCSFLNHRRADGELTPTCPDGIPRMPKRLSWRSSCLGFSGPNIFQKAGCSLNVARSSCWTEWELISALPLPVAIHDRF